MINRKIVDVIKDYPIVGEFLLLHNIECATCTIASCQLKDILNVHMIPKSIQVQMMEYIDDLIYGKTTTLKQFIFDKEVVQVSPIMQRLYDEHEVILSMIYVGEYLLRKQDYVEPFKQLLSYFASYADTFHHGKEENMLFYLYKGNLDLVDSMYDEHVLGRSLIQTIIDNNYQPLDIKNYFTFLKDHIRKENEVVFPYLDKILDQENSVIATNILNQYDLSIEHEVLNYIESMNQFSF